MELGAKAGVALNPSTPVNTVENVAEFADFLLLMSVDPGYGGQEFIPYILRKINLLKKFLEKRGFDTLLEVDGGVNLTNTGDIVSAGADILVAGSSIFHSDDPAATLERMIEIANPDGGDEEGADEA